MWHLRSARIMLEAAGGSDIWRGFHSSTACLLSLWLAVLDLRWSHTPVSSGHRRIAAMVRLMFDLTWSTQERQTVKPSARPWSSSRTFSTMTVSMMTVSMMFSPGYWRPNWAQATASLGARTHDQPTTQVARSMQVDRKMNWFRQGSPPAPFFSRSQTVAGPKCETGVSLAYPKQKIKANVSSLSAPVVRQANITSFICGSRLWKVTGSKLKTLE